MQEGPITAEEVALVELFQQLDDEERGVILYASKRVLAGADPDAIMAEVMEWASERNAKKAAAHQ